MKSLPRNNDIADPVLYRLYWSIVLRDILYKLGYDTTKKNKEILHDFHKRALGYETIAGRSNEVVGRFIFEVCAEWAIQGIFVRNNRKQPLGIEDKEFSDIIMVDEKEHQIWDLL